MIFVMGALSGLLLASVLANIFQYRIRRQAVEAALQHEQRLIDRARAAESRAEHRIDGFLDRLAGIRPAPIDTPQPDPDVRTYISDLPHDDEEWNDYRGEPDEDYS